jgi:hypothetical protein
MKKYIILIVTFLFLISGCAILSSNGGFSPAFKDEKFSSRSVPAKISKESEQILETKGYVYLGSMQLEENVKSCWDKECLNFECTDNLPHKDMVGEVLEKAAVQGGDVLILESNAKPAISSINKTGGPCVSWGDKDIQVSYCCKEARGYCESTCYRTQTLRNVCIAWGTIDGKKCSFVTRGKIWRYDPEISRKQEKYITLKKIYEKNKEDKINRGNVLDWFKDGAIFGFKDKSGKIVIKPKFTDVNTDGWGENLIAVAVGEKDKKLYGYIDKNGKWAISPSYKAAGRFSEGLAVVKVNEKYVYIDKTGRTILNPPFTNVGEFHEGIAMIYVFTPNNSYSSSTSEIVRKALESTKCGYMDKTGNVIIEPQYLVCNQFSDGVASVKSLDSNFGFIDRKGVYVIKPQFDRAAEFIDGIGKIVIGNKEGYINKTGEVVLEL